MVPVCSVITREEAAYLSPSRAGEQDGLVVQLEKLAKGFITVFEAMPEDHRADDVTHCIRYDVLRIEGLSCVKCR